MKDSTLSARLTALLTLRGETRANYPGMTDAEIFDTIARKIRRRSPVASLALRAGSLALRTQAPQGRDC